MKLTAIDAYCKEKGIPRSELLVNSAMGVINARGGVKCGFQGCQRRAIGKYKLTVYSMDLGEEEKVLNLCEYHLSSAKREGVVKDAE